MQDRIGPNRVGPCGLFQPIADGLKFLFKEDIIPDAATSALSRRSLPRRRYRAAGLRRRAVRPDVGAIRTSTSSSFAARTSTSASCSSSPSPAWRSTASSWAAGRRTTSTASSAALRSSAQIISYEIPMGMSVLGVVLLGGSLNLETDHRHQVKRVLGLEHLLPAAGVPAVPDQRLRRVQPAAVRPARGASRSWSAATTPSTAR